MTTLTIDHLKSDAAAIMANLNECWSDGAAITHTASALCRIHVGLDRETAIVACEQARWGAWS